MRVRNLMPVEAELVAGNMQALLSHDSLSALNRSTLDSKSDIARLLGRAKAKGVRLNAGMDERNQPRLARIIEVCEDRVRLDLRGSRIPEDGPLYFSFSVDARDYFFVGTRASHPGAIELPAVLYRAERREVPRDERVQGAGVEMRVAGDRILGRVTDRSYQGLGIRTLAPVEHLPDRPFELRFLDGPDAGKRAFGQLCHASMHAGGAQLGVRVSGVPFGPSVPIESRNAILDAGAATRAVRTARFFAAAARGAGGRLLSRGSQAEQAVRIVAYRNTAGHEIRAILDRSSDRPGGTAVIIPPAWGRTKETLLPLAMTLIDTFAAAHEPLTVVRFDGTYRRGESHVPEDLRERGREAERFTFSHGVRDIIATQDFLSRSADLKPDRTVLVTFSLASIDGRRAVATQHPPGIDGWVCVVGMADLQSGLRAVSGGIDYGYGLMRGVRFGVHRLGGVLVDMDNAGSDVVQNRLGFVEDARRDMASISVPVTWIHGKHDGWIDLDRVQSIMSAGDTRERRLIEVPTGHQLRSSRQALETFQLVATETARIALGKTVEPAIPDLAALDARNRAERARIAGPPPDVRGFWSEYLMGEQGQVGIEFLTATSAYQEFMSKQIDALGIRDSDCILDLGAGVGDFAVAVSRAASAPAAITVVALDYVVRALKRGRSRLDAGGGAMRVRSIAADLNTLVPLHDASADSAIASLLLGYVDDPKGVLRELRRVVRPGGRLVVSMPKRDADISKVYVEGLRELDPVTVRHRFGPLVERDFERLQRDFLNSGAILMDFEEAGVFQFWEPEELAALVESAGFSGIAVAEGLGDPPQAVIVSARRD